MIKETVTWAMSPDVCADINVDITGTGQRKQETETKHNRDGSTVQVIDDVVKGTAVDTKGGKYTFLYVNHSTWVTNKSGTSVSIRMKDLFLLTGIRSKTNNLHVAFDWGWTYDPTQSEYWPPNDSLVEYFTLGEPLTCDPI